MWDCQIVLWECPIGTRKSTCAVKTCFPHWDVCQCYCSSSSPSSCWHESHSSRCRWLPTAVLMSSFQIWFLITAASSLKILAACVSPLCRSIWCIPQGKDSLLFATFLSKANTSYPLLKKKIPWQYNFQIYIPLVKTRGTIGTEEKY